MKKLILLVVVLFSSAVFSQGQEHSGGIVVPTGFKITANQPVDDRTVVADSISLISIPNQYEGLTAYSIADQSLFVKTATDWEKVGSNVDNLPIVSASTSGIVNNTPLQELGGVDKLINGVRIGRGNNSLSYNYVFGDNSLGSITTGNGNVAVGGSTLALQTTGSYNLGIGFSALFYNRGSNNLAIGTGALSGSSNNTYSRNIAIGTSAGNSLTTGNDNILIGGDIGVGVSAGLLSGSNNVIIGKLDNKIRTSSNNNTIIGGFSEVSDTSMNDNIILSDGKGNIGFRKDDNGLTTSPTQSQLSFDSDLSGKAIVTKEILGNALEDYIQEPSTDGTSGQVLTTDGDGGVSWTTPTGGITALTGDVTASGSGSVVATIADDVVTPEKLTEKDYVRFTEADIAWNSASAPESNSWYSVTYGNDKFVAVSYSGTNRVMYSSDGITWNLASAPEANSWYSVTYGNGKFVAVSINGTNRVMYSSDGITWTSASAPENNIWLSVTYGNDKFVAVSQDGTNRVMYSSDGITWLPASAPGNNEWRSVTYGNGKFVAVAYTGTNRVMYSTDGITWNSASTPEANSWSSVTYGNGKFVAVSSSGTDRVMYSTDGITWTSASATEANSWFSVTYGDGKFVAVAYNGTNRVMYSSDGITWNSASAPENNQWRSVTYGDGKFVALSTNGTNRVMYYSFGGLNFDIPTSALINDGDGTAGQFLSDPLGGTSGQVLTTDGSGGISWTTVSSDIDLQKTLDNGNTADGVGIILTDGSSLGQYYAGAIGIQENVGGGGNGITISPAEGGFLYAGDNGRVHLGDRDGVVGLNFETLSAKVNIIPPTSFGNATHTLQNKSGVLAHVEDLEDYILEPTTDGTSGQVLTTDGSGGRSWTTVSGGGTPFNPIAGTGINLSGTYPNITITNSLPNLYQTFETTLTIGNLVEGAAANAGFTMSSSNAGTGETHQTQVNKNIVGVSYRPDAGSPLTSLTMSGIMQGMRMQIGNDEVAHFGVFNDDLGVHFHNFFETASISITAPTKTGIRVQELQDKSGTIALLSDVSESIEDSFSAVEESTNFTLDDTHKNKQILITGNNIVVTIPNTLPNNFNVTLDFSGTGATIINNASATGDGDHTSSPYDIPQNGMIYIYKTESGTVRIKGDIL